MQKGDTARDMLTLKVASMSNPNKVATSIIKNMEEGKDVEAVSIGAGATTQSLKAIIIARGQAATKGWDLTVRPGFQCLFVNGEERTAIKLVVLRG